MAATTLAPSFSALEADVAAQLAPVRGIERSQLRADWHRYAVSWDHRRIVDAGGRYPQPVGVGVGKRRWYATIFSFDRPRSRSISTERRGGSLSQAGFTPRSSSPWPLIGGFRVSGGSPSNSGALIRAARQTWLVRDSRQHAWKGGGGGGGAKRRAADRSASLFKSCRARRPKVGGRRGRGDPVAAGDELEKTGRQQVRLCQRHLPVPQAGSLGGGECGFRRAEKSDNAPLSPQFAVELRETGSVGGKPSGKPIL